MVLSWWGPPYGVGCACGVGCAWGVGAWGAGAWGVGCARGAGAWSVGCAWGVGCACAGRCAALPRRPAGYPLLCRKKKGVIAVYTKIFFGWRGLLAIAPFFRVFWATKKAACSLCREQAAVGWVVLGGGADGGAVDGYGGGGYGCGGVKTPPYGAAYTVVFPVNPAWGKPLPGGIYASPTNEISASTKKKHAMPRTFAP